MWWCMRGFETWVLERGGMIVDVVDVVDLENLLSKV